MTFIVALIALLAERFFNCAHLRNWNGFATYQHAIHKRFTAYSPYLQLALVVVPPAVLTFIIVLLLRGWLYGALTFLFQLAVVIYCLGPRNLWADSYAQMPSSTPAADETHLPEPSFLSRIFVEAHRRIFALIFWYFIFGPVAAVLYRLITLAVDTQDQETTAAYLHAAKTVNAVVDWLPVRIFTFCFALGGHFVRTLAVWRTHVLLGLASNEPMLIDCGLASLGNEADVAVDKSAISLIDRVFVIVLVVMAVCSLIA